MRGEAARAREARFPPASIAPPTFQILTREPEGGKGRLLCSKVGKGKGGRRDWERGVWLSKVLNLESKLGVGEQRVPSVTRTTPFRLPHLPQTQTRQDLGARDLNLS